MKWAFWALIALTTLAIVAEPAFAQAAPAASPAAPVDNGGALSRAMGQISGDGRSLSLSLQILILMSLLTVLPSLILMMTSFTRIIIVLSILRQALGLQQTPPNQVLVGLSLFLSLFVMRPAIDTINAQAFDPYGKGQISIEEAVGRSGKVLHGFMTKQTRESDLKLFVEMSRMRAPRTAKDVPMHVLLPAFIISEMKTAFTMGFVIFLPFLVVDLVVSLVLMSMGMVMLPPALVSLPFKLLLFVLVDGWHLLAQALGLQQTP
ncbi:MAG: flagellar type III secretion system pore protein FliP, partial [Sphingobium sp.]